MLRFFRLLRRKFLEEGHVHKYFWYALGEILLVMIGILLALQVNQWNENANNAKEEQFYYAKLVENLQQDTTNLSILITQLDNQILLIEEVINDFNTKSSEKLEPDIASALIRLSFYNPEIATWDNLKSTGKINIIQNQEVIDSLTSYYNRFNNNTKLWMNANRDYSRNHIGPYLMKFDDIRLDFGEDLTFEYEEIFGSQKRSVNEYKEDVFIRNALIFKRSNLFGLRTLLKQDLQRAINILKILKI